MQATTTPAANIVAPTATLGDLATIMADLSREHPAAGARVQHGAFLALMGHAEDASAGAYWVTSERDGTTQYFVLPQYGTCTCQDFQRHGSASPCKHLLCVETLARLERLETDREQAPFLCDVCGAGVDYDQVSPDVDAPPLCARCLHVSLLPPPDADAPITLALSDAAYAALAEGGEPCAIEPQRPVGITRLPTPAHLQRFADELGMGV